MLYREIIAVCSQIHIKHINTLCGQNVEFVYVKPGEVLGDRSTLYIRVTLYWGYLIVFWLFHLGVFCTVVVLTSFVMCGCVYVWVL